MGDRARSSSPAAGELPDADARLLEQIHSGDVEAGQRFIQEHYPAIHRYLLYLTGCSELAADLTQETFLQAWRHLDTFEGRAEVRAWLHSIARREFLQVLRRRRAEASLEAMAEVPQPDATAWMEAVELRELLHRLPLGEREVMVLHHLEGYTSSEIARIVQAPASSVRRRLAQARERLRQELGEGDLAYLNELLAPMRQWHWLPLDQMQALEARLAPKGRAGKEEAMERREFLRQAAAGAAGLMLSDAEKEVIDGRLTRKVTLAFKGTALSDVCDHLRGEAGVHLAAGTSVADEKVSLFCKELPLRDVMRQLSRPFGYTWARSKREDEYRYELLQDLRSQLLEEELRNRDRHAALLALEREIERFRPYLSLLPDEALARAKTAASPEEKQLMERLGSRGWGPLQMYFRLSPQDHAALRAGERLTFSQVPRSGEQPLPPELAKGILQCLRNWRIIKTEEGYRGTTDATDPRGVPLAALPEARAQVRLELRQSELGQYTLGGWSGAFTPDRNSGHAGPTGFGTFDSDGPVAAGTSGTAPKPAGRAAGATETRDPALRARVTLQPRPSCLGAREPASRSAGGSSPDPAGPSSASTTPEAPSQAHDSVTSADVLEALHRATGIPVVADYYTRLHGRERVSLREMPLATALDQLADEMRLRWAFADGWLQFRTLTYYDDRHKEVPNRLLNRWSAARRPGAHGTPSVGEAAEGRGVLTLEDLIEIAQLSDAQLDGAAMAEGARACYGLGEWDLVRNGVVRPQLRFLAELTPAQRQMAMGPTGLAFEAMSLAQQQHFITEALGRRGQPLRSLDELAGSALRVDYTQPGWFQWQPPGPEGFKWVRLLEPGPQGKRVPNAPVRARTREAALQAALRVDPAVRAVMLEAARRHDPRLDESRMVPALDQIVPTRLDLEVIYIAGASNWRPVHILRRDQDLTTNVW